jgi:hypothetical protein
MSILNLSGSGEGGSYIRYMPSTNAWMADGAEVDIKEMVFDLDSLRTGWGKMAEGMAPDWQWDERLGVRGNRPSPEHKRGFSIKVYSKATGLREWSTTGTGPVMGFEAVIDSIWGAKDANAEKVPVVAFKGSKPVKVGKGSTRVPEFELKKWIVAPAEMGAAAPAASAEDDDTVF